MNPRTRIVFVALTAVCVALVPLCVLTGSVDIPASEVWNAIAGAPLSRDIYGVIVCQSRIPTMLTALLSGIALSVAGLVLQTTFRNPLAGPSILGVSTGASLGAGLVIMAFGAVMGAYGRVATLFGAFVGAAAVIMLLLVFSGWLRNGNALLIVGILISYLTSSIISLLNFFASSEGVRAFVMWGLGNFSSTPPSALWMFGVLTVFGAIWVWAEGGHLNALLLGWRNAMASGVNTKALRTRMLLVAGVLTAVVTAWCGPIGFIGLVVPHVARLLLGSSNHRLVLPATVLVGAILGLACQILAALPARAGLGVIPVNAITPVLGVPVIIYIIVRRNKIFYL